jgi:hypothetical protein
MHFRTITARRLINTGNYENTAFELSAELAPGEDLAAASTYLHEALVKLITAERERRYPEDRERAYQVWLEEDERAQA